MASITDLCHTDSLRFPSHQVFVLPRHLPTTSPLSNHRKTLLCHRKVQLELSELPGSAPSLSKPQLLSLPPCWYQFTRGHLKPPSARSLWCRGHKLLTAPSLFCLPFGHTQPRAFHQLFPNHLIHALTDLFSPTGALRGTQQHFPACLSLAYPRCMRIVFTLCHLGSYNTLHPNCTMTCKSPNTTDI